MQNSTSSATKAFGSSWRNLKKALILLWTISRLRFMATEKRKKVEKSSTEQKRELVGEYFLRMCSFSVQKFIITEMNLFY